ncbi:MAG: aspartate aminotransferase family protein, partial [Paraburkholderia tropica]
DLTWHSRTEGFERGAIVRSTNGRLIVAPPLVIDHAQIDALIGTMRDAVEATWRHIQSAG